MNSASCHMHTENSKILMTGSWDLIGMLNVAPNTAKLLNTVFLDPDDPYFFNPSQEDCEQYLEGHILFYSSYKG